jgi:hypothetical protein
MNAAAAGWQSGTKPSATVAQLDLAKGCQVPNQASLQLKGGFETGNLAVYRQLPG